MKPIIKWAGGKEKELPIIKKYKPDHIDRFIEPFVGGGSVFLGLENNKNCINDKSSELINLYECLKNKNKSFVTHINYLFDKFSDINDLASEKDSVDLYKKKISIDDFISIYKKSLVVIGEIDSDVFLKEVYRNLKSKLRRLEKIEKKNTLLLNNDITLNIETSLKSAFYMTVRYLYNHPDNYKLCKGKRASIYFFIREYCYSSMFRYNKDGKFNVPYGGMSYNRKNLDNKINYITSKEVYDLLKNTDIQSLDFEKFLNLVKPKKNDFIFLDPPYDSEFSSYSGSSFGKNEQIRLRDYLLSTSAKFMLIIKNTDFIFNLYKNNKFYISDFDKKYMVSFMNRNNRDVKHLLITNYEMR